MAAHMMTARRRAALRKAQLASARKRKGRGRNKKMSRDRKIAIAAGGLALASIAAGYSNHRRLTKQVHHTKAELSRARARAARSGRMVIGLKGNNAQLHRQNTYLRTALKNSNKRFR